ncbi:MAG: hypothetical protein NTX75_08445 [Proteobacteria bacterium]|nr:hypothetical protein [Pseudomonadota bacterium]
MGRINLDELKEMLSSGATQASRSRYFKVSEPAITKAVRKLK